MALSLALIRADDRTARMGNLVSSRRGGVVIDPELELAIVWQRAHPAPSLHSIPVETARSNYAAAAGLLDPTPPDDVALMEMVIPGPAGAIHAHLYTPPGCEGSGIVVWAHGGGWVLGGLTSHDHACRRLASAARLRLLAIDYRLAPEHPFPAGQDDVSTVVRWVVQHAGQLGAPAIGVGGDSAGATLALVAALDDGDGLACLALCYPSLGPDIMSESRKAFDGGWGLTTEDMDFFFERLLPEGHDRSDPRVSPLLTPEVEGVPSTVLSIAGYDILHDEGLALAGMLEGAGVTVDLFDEGALTHGFLRLGGLSAEVRAAIDRFAAAMRSTMERANT